MKRGRREISPPSPATNPGTERFPDRIDADQFGKAQTVSEPPRSVYEFSSL